MEYQYYPNDFTKNQVFNYKKAMKDHLSDIVQDCEEVCFSLLRKLINRSDLYQRKDQMQILSACAEICTSTAILLAQESPLLEDQLRHCYKACILCAQECSKYNDEDSIHCARVCYHCALECRYYLMV